MMITLPHFSLSQKMTALILFNERSLFTPIILKDLLTRQKILGQPIGQVTRQRNGITDKNIQTKMLSQEKHYYGSYSAATHVLFFYLNPVTFSPQVARPLSCAKKHKMISK